MMDRTSILIHTESPWQGRGDHWEASVTMITVGVHAGSAGPVFWADHVLRQAAPSWEGIPLALDHPKVDGQFVSINHSSAVRAKYQIGKVTRPFFDSAKKAIRATIQVPRNHPQIEKIKKIREVSVGIFGDHTQTYGSHNGKEYEKCAINMIPDHLAALPDGIGACDWAAGCGIRVHRSENERLLGNALATWIENLRNEVRPMQDYPDQAVFPAEVYEAERQKDELATLAAWEGNPNPPMEVLELRRKHAEKQQSQGRGGGYADEAVYPPDIV